jgi:hypothetical protein
MKEVRGNLWDYYGRIHTAICITTNGTVKSNGMCVMGRGCAKEATQRISGIALELGRKIRAVGNVVQSLDNFKIWAFPVKHNWYETADLELIKKSALSLKLIAECAAYSHYQFYLPRPGCGNGHLLWENVRPLLLDLPDNVKVITF